MFHPVRNEIVGVCPTNTWTSNGVYHIISRYKVSNGVNAAYYAQLVFRQDNRIIFLGQDSRIILLILLSFLSILSNLPARRLSQNCHLERSEWSIG